MWKRAEVLAAIGLCMSVGTALPVAQARESHALVGLINHHRGSPQDCEGARTAMAGPLAPQPVLATVPASAGARLQEALKEAGYAASRSVLITLAGPGDATAAMRLLEQRYCKLLSSPRYSEIGVSQEGGRWRIVLAQPALSPDLGDWQTAGRRIVEIVNEARSKPRSCGGRRFEAAPPVQWNAKLAAASLAHSRDMASHDYFAHEGRGGTQVGDRVRREGYDWRAVGENIAAGQGSPQQVMASWLSSPGHCSNIMSPRFTEMGAAHAIEPASEATIYWTQVFGTRHLDR